MKNILTTMLSIAIAVPAIAGNWSPVGDNIMSPWAEDVNPECPLPEYPRPQMVREQWMNLNGLWKYGITEADAENFSVEGEILVPFAAESSLSGVGRRMDKEDALWYERTFSVPKDWKGKQILLHFGAVDWETTVYVNGIEAGTHRGGYDPFSFDITPYLKKSGTQTLRVKVLDATDDSFQPRGKQCHINGGIWYTPVSGIWQTVWMEPVPLCSISGYYVESDIENSSLAVYVDARTSGGDEVKVSLIEGREGYSAENPGNEIVCEAIARNGKAVLQIPDMKTWSPSSPYLYGLRIELCRDGRIVDSVEGYTAMREISVMREEGLYEYRRMTLNGEPLFHFGPLDQGWWPDGLYTAPTDEALKFDIEKTKEMGFNMIRKHIKVEPARWYWWCDVMGMMVWQDMPCIGDYMEVQAPARSEEVVEANRNTWSSGSILGGTDCKVPAEWKANFYHEWGAVMDALKVFQCIVMWVPFNEAWGQFDTPEVVAFTRSKDSTRLINEASGGNYSLCGDVIDVHNYPAPVLKFFERKFVNVLGEYGGIGYVVPGHTWNIAEKWGYEGVKDSSEELLDQYIKYLEDLKALIRTGCAAAVYTQTTDVEGEVNGLMTYDRKVIKVDIPKISEANKALIQSMND